MEKAPTVAQWGMAKNMRAKARREIGRPKAEVDNTTIDQASPRQLSDWLKNPPRKSLHQQWRNSPWPLRRAVELERADLFAKWVEHGCSPAGKLGGFAIPLVRMTGAGTSRFIEWVCMYSPGHLVEVLEQLREDQMAQVYTRQVNWRKVLGAGMLNTRSVVELATMATLGMMEGLPVEDLLRASGGKISQGWGLENVLLKYIDAPNGSRISAVDVRPDQKMAEHINHLPPGALREANAGMFATTGLLLSAQAVIEQINFNSGYSVGNPRKTPCRNFGHMFTQWNNSGRGVEEARLVEAIDTVAPYIQWRKRDRLGRGALECLSITSWPEGAIQHLVDTIIKVQPPLAKQKNKEGLLPEQSEKNSEWVRSYIRAYKKRAGMGKILRHNVRQTQAIREARQEQDRERPANTRKPLM